MSKKGSKIIQIIALLIMSLIMFIPSKFQIFPLNLAKSLGIICLAAVIIITISLIREK